MHHKVGIESACWMNLCLANMIRQLATLIPLHYLFGSRYDTLLRAWVNTYLHIPPHHVSQPSPHRLFPGWPQHNLSHSLSPHHCTFLRDSSTFPWLSEEVTCFSLLCCLCNMPSCWNFFPPKDLMAVCHLYIHSFNSTIYLVIHAFQIDHSNKPSHFWNPFPFTSL